MKRKLLALAVIAFASSAVYAQYCTGGPSSTYDTNLQNASLVGESSTITYLGCTGGGGGGITGLELQLDQVADLKAGNTYTIVCGWGTCGGNYYNSGNAWIDFDGDGSFESGEIIAQRDYGPGGYYPTAYTFTVPVDAAVGETRLRIMTHEGGVAPLNPCASYAWGSKVDFTIDITPFCDVMDIATGSTELCEGDETFLDATSYSGGIVTWDGGVIDGVDFTPPVGTTIYTSSSTSPTDCVYEVEITVNELPTVTAGVSTEEACFGHPIVFFGSGASTYVWDMGVVDGEPYTPGDLGTETYTVIGYDDFGCEGTSSVDVTVNPSPSVSGSSSEDEICEGESIILTVSGDADYYEWDPADITPGVPYTPADGVDTYTVTGYFDATGCSTEDVVTITLNPTPFVAASAGDGIFCENESIVLASSGDADIVSWSPGDFMPGPGTYTYTVSGYYEGFEGCPATASVDVEVVTLPVVTATTDLDQTCIGGSIVLTGGGAVSYVWDMGVTNGVPYTPAGIGVATYTVVGTDANGCKGSASVDAEVMDVITISADITLETVGGDGAIDITISGGVAPYTFDWSNNGFGAFTDPEDLVDINEGEYKVFVKGSTGCEANRTFRVESQLSIQDLAIDDLSVYPNPTTDFVNIRLEGNFNYQLHAINGAVLFSGSAVDQQEINLEDLADGVYFVTLSNETGSVTVKVVKQ